MERPYEFQFYETDQGDKPALRWLDGLVQSKNAAMAAAMRYYLQVLGPDVCKTKMGERVGQGVVEFKVWQDEDELLRQAGLEGGGASGSSDAILLRLFVHFHGDHRILVIDGYDKKRNDSLRVQSRKINEARKMLADHKRRSRS